MKSIVIPALAALSLTASGVAFAQPTPPPGQWDLARREAWLQERIDRGVENGSLARGEQHRVQRELRGIRHDERRLTREEGGVLRPSDRAMLEQRLDHLGHRIRWLKHNDQYRPPWA